MDQDIKLIDIRTCGYTRSQMMGYIAGFQRILPDCEIFMDGDEYAIVARRKQTTTPRGARKGPRGSGGLEQAEPVQGRLRPGPS